MTLKKDARNRGIPLTYKTKNGKRAVKPPSQIIKEIRKHDDEIISTRAKQAESMILTCKAIMSLLNVRPSGSGRKANTPFVTPPTSPPKPKGKSPTKTKMKAPPPPPPPPPPPKGKTCPAPIQASTARIAV